MHDFVILNGSTRVSCPSATGFEAEVRLVYLALIAYGSSVGSSLVLGFCADVDRLFWLALGDSASPTEECLLERERVSEPLGMAWLEADDDGSFAVEASSGATAED